MIRYAKSKAFVTVAIIVSQVLSGGCTESSFTGGSAAMKKRPGSGRTIPPTVGKTIDLPKGSLLSDQRKVEASKIQKIWTVSRAGVATLFIVDGDKVTTKSWSGIKHERDGNLGIRTYVTEGGFVAGRYPFIYFIDPENTPEGPLQAANKKDIEAKDRICLASYVKNNKRYLFAAFGNGGYWDIPMSDEKPYRPLWDDPGVVKNSGNANFHWGYSCYIDQTRNIFYSQHSSIGAINLNTLQYVLTGAPNHAHTSSDPVLSNLTKSSRSTGSYAISGDPDGNVYNGSGVYTMAYDSSADAVWVTMQSSPLNNIGIFPRECLTSKKTCTGYLNFTASPVGSAIGPMSALRDGRVVGVTRDFLGSVYIMSLRDTKDLTKGFVTKLVGMAGSDPYMYTDFTGATLYIREAAQVFDMSKQAGYKSGAPNASTVFTWKSKSGVNKPWKDIKLEVRCFDDESKKPGYEEIKTVGNADKYTDVTVASCAGKVAKFVEVQVTQQNNSTSLADIEFLQIAIKQ